MKMTDARAEILAGIRQARSLKDMWSLYLRCVVPSDLTPVQIDAVQRTFYAGADGLFTLMLRGSESESLALLKSLEDELSLFRRQAQHQSQKRREEGTSKKWHLQ